MSVDVTQITSDISGATESKPVIVSPYLIWNPSIIVTNFLFLMGSAKNSPPKPEDKEESEVASDVIGLYT